MTEDFQISPDWFDWAKSEPRVATNKESKDWQSFFKDKRSATIDFGNLVPEWEPKIYQSEVEYYYRRGNKYFFKVNNTKMSIEAKNHAELKKLKYGKYPAKFNLV